MTFVVKVMPDWSWYRRANAMVQIRPVRSKYHQIKIGTTCTDEIF